MDAPHLGKDARIDIATGHFGTIQPPFLTQMVRTVRRDAAVHGGGEGDGGEGDGGEGDEWSDIGRTFLYHSSRATVLADCTDSFAVLRTTAPGAGSHERILSKYFHDALPKFNRQVSDESTRDNNSNGKRTRDNNNSNGSSSDSDGKEALTPILHGKAILAVAADGTRGVMVVGSQNFSKAWSTGIKPRRDSNLDGN